MVVMATPIWKILARPSDIFCGGRVQLFVLLLLLSTFLSAEVSAQKRFAKTFPVKSNARLEIVNRSGSVTVSSWARNEIKIEARIEAPAAKVTPQMINGSLVINVVRENQDKLDVGSVNFDIKVPESATVDVETRVGNISVRDISGARVRASVTSEGDISLTGISSASVSAENIIGDIFFDGSLSNGGGYKFVSTRGNINIRIPFDSSFKLVATAPSTKQISLGSFANSGLNFVSNGRRVVGTVGSGAASVTATNQRGSISFVRR